MINSPEHKLQKNILWSKIKAVGEFWGEDQKELKKYAKSVYEQNAHCLKEAIECFDDLLTQAKILNSKG